MLKTLRPPLDTIGSGVEITVFSLAGNEALKYKTHERVTYITLAHALLQRLSAQTSIPQRCFTLTMNPTSKAGNGSGRIVVQYVTHAIEDDCRFGDGECFVCGDPCLDASVEERLPEPKVTSYTNCVICQPSDLCADCRVSVRGTYYCFYCIELEVAEEVTGRKRGGAVSGEVVSTVASQYLHPAGRCPLGPNIPMCPRARALHPSDYYLQEIPACPDLGSLPDRRCVGPEARALRLRQGKRGLSCLLIRSRVFFSNHRKAIFSVCPEFRVARGNDISLMNVRGMNVTPGAGTGPCGVP